MLQQCNFRVANLLKLSSKYICSLVNYISESKLVILYIFTVQLVFQVNYSVFCFSDPVLVSWPVVQGLGPTHSLQGSKTKIKLMYN